MDIFYTYCNPQWNLIFNFLHLIICWLLWFKVFVLFTSVCQNSHWLINMPLGSHKAILCDLNTYFKVSTCFPNRFHLCRLLRSWKNVSYSVEPFLFGLSVFWDNISCFFTLFHTFSHLLIMPAHRVYFILEQSMMLYLSQAISALPLYFWFIAVQTFLLLNT